MDTVSNPIPLIQNAKHSEELIFCTHALQKMIQRGISVDQIEQVLDCSDVEILEVYPQIGRPSAECLILGIDKNGKYLHILVAYPITEVITTYEPTLPKWITPRQRRKI